MVRQTIEMALDLNQADAVRAFDRRVSYDARRRELTALSDREELNFLRVNMAADVAQRRRSVSEAQGNFVKILELEAAGKSSPYLQGLRAGINPP